jgi:hypothetical protein
MYVTTDVPNPTRVDPDLRGIVRLDLVEKVPASEFGKIIQAIDELYFADLWLGIAEAAPRRQDVPEYYEPKDKEKLYIKKLEIGTPNLIELIGMAQHMLPAFTTIATVLGAPTALAKLIHEIGATRQAFAQAKNLDVDTALKKIDLQTKTHQLLEQGKITPEQAKHKLAMKQESESYLKAVLPTIASAPQFRLVESTPEPRVRRQTEIAVGGHPLFVKSSDVEARLKALAGPGKDAVVHAFVQALKSASERRDAASRVKLKIVRKKMMDALGLSEEHVESILREKEM